jgi:L-arabinokinase
VVRHLIAAGHEVHVATAVPEFVFTAELPRSPSSQGLLHIRRAILDCGAVQTDALTVDPLASLLKVFTHALLAFHAAASLFIFHLFLSELLWNAVS